MQIVEKIETVYIIKNARKISKICINAGKKSIVEKKRDTLYNRKSKITVKMRKIYDFRCEKFNPWFW